jgi:hypothetical protein
LTRDEALALHHLAQRVELHAQAVLAQLLAGLDEGARHVANAQLSEATQDLSPIIIGAKLLREVQPGELVSLSERGIETRQVIEGERRAFCARATAAANRADRGTRPRGP